MSVLGADGLRRHDKRPIAGDDAASATTGGQNHERIPTPAMSQSKMDSGDNGIEVTVLQRMSSATLGSLMTSLLATPLDVVRVRLQSQPTPSSSVATNGANRFSAHTSSFQRLPPNLGVTACCREVFWVGDNAQYCLAGSSTSVNASRALPDVECAVEETQRKTFTSTFDGLKKIARNEGALTLWRGLSPTLLMAIPANVIYFTGYDWLRYNSASPVRRVANDMYSPLVAGSVARVAAAIAVSPIEMFRTRMQATSGTGSGLLRSTFDGLYQMTQTQGYTSLWRGLTLTMWRDVPFSAIYWWGYEAVRNALTDVRMKSQQIDAGDAPYRQSRRYSQSQEKHSTTFIDSFIAGNISGAFASIVTTPFDVGKTRQQVYRHAGASQSISAAAQSAGEMAASKVIPEQLSMPRFLYHILKTEGTSGLFKGWAARCLKVAPSCGIMISSYELGKKWARTMNDKQQSDRRSEAL